MSYGRMNSKINMGAMPNMGMGARQPNMSMPTFNFSFPTRETFSTKGETLGQVVLNTIGKIIDTILEIYKNDIMFYIALILIGIGIYYLLRYFIGIKLGREKAIREIKKKAEKKE